MMSSEGLANVQAFFPDEGEKAQRELLLDLCSEELGQSHLFEHSSGTDDIGPSIRRMGAQLEELDNAYPGGLRAYILNAKKLLKGSKEGANPLDGWSPSIPQGEAFELGTPEFETTEELGITQIGNVGFVLVAGGLGERLGYNGTKIGLPVETTTGICYLQYYCEYIKAVQDKFAGKKQLPLCIMVSNDTKQPTLDLLKDNKCFGLERRQVFIVQQGAGVPALSDNEAKFATDPNDPFKILTKPHGHGDIHALLYKDSITKNWEENFGTKYLVIFQDTNGLAFHTLPLMLGVSEKRGFIMNSLTIPRKAKQAIGGVAKLTKQDTGEERTINVEYNQLDPCLRATEEFKNGDVNDKSGYSPFPGNINQLLFRLDAYNKILQRTQGIMPDFVNPKYKDESKTIFKKPTRLECMMQDFPTVLNKEESPMAGFTQVATELCFSPVKNSVADGVVLQGKGIAPGTAATGEADQYAAFRTMLRSRGCQIEDAAPVEYNGIKVVPGPAIVLKPDFAFCPGQYNVKFPFPEKVKISSRSTLVVRGSEVIIESLDLDGALIIDVEGHEETVIRDLVVKNDGWIQDPDIGDADEKTKMRGFKIVRKDSRRIEVRDENLKTPGEDGSKFAIEETFCCSLFPVGMEEENDPVCSLL